MYLPNGNQVLEIEPEVRPQLQLTWEDVVRIVRFIYRQVEPSRIIEQVAVDMGVLAEEERAEAVPQPTRRSASGSLDDAPAAKHHKKG